MKVGVGTGVKFLAYDSGSQAVTTKIIVIKAVPFAP